MKKNSIKKSLIDELRRIAALLSLIAILGGLYAIFIYPDSSGEPMNQTLDTTSETETVAGTTAEPNINSQASDQPTEPIATLTPIPPTTNSSNDSAVRTVNNPEALNVVVNKLQALPANYTPATLIYSDVAAVSSGMIMRPEAAAALGTMFQAATADGLPLQLVSAYRSYDIQAGLFNSYAATYGEAEANRFSARPGQSEHQTGLAVDVSGIDGICSLETCFGSTESGQWVAANAPTYGFIVRYPAGAEGITGYSYEPWHLRYVGVDLAQQIAASGLTMEQYVQ